YYYLLIRNVPRPYPSYPDLCYICDYVFFISGLVLFVRRQSPGRDAVSLVDAAIVATSVGLLSWVFLIRPSVVDVSAPFLDKTVGMTYAVLDVFLLTLAARVAMASRRQVTSIVLVAAILFVATADWISVILSYEPGTSFIIGRYYVLYL